MRTGLDMVEALEALNAGLVPKHRVRLAVRIGIHTGLVVIGDMGGGGRQEQLALGETPNVAARLQGLAAPDTVAISAATFQLVRGYFTYQELGAHALKGLTPPVQVYRILEESEVHLSNGGASPGRLCPGSGWMVNKLTKPPQWLRHRFSPPKRESMPFFMRASTIA